MNRAVILRPAITQADLEDLRRLFREYEEWLDFNLCFQGFEEELRTLPGRYAPPTGRLYLADVSDLPAAPPGPVGCVALREFAPGIGEMKRLYVRDAARGLGLGRTLTKRIIEDARAVGQRTLRLDTLRIEKMSAANRLYDSLGFREIAPYYNNPLPEVRYMELELTSGPPSAF